MRNGSSHLSLCFGDGDLCLLLGVGLLSFFFREALPDLDRLLFRDRDLFLLRSLDRRRRGERDLRLLGDLDFDLDFLLDRDLLDLKRENENHD
jgi:hypothetical protein